MKMLLIVSLLLTSVWGEAQLLQMCNDDGEWPPYFYQKRNAFGEKTEIMTGASKEILDSLMGKIGYAYTFDLIPWKRCMVSVEFFGQDKTYEAFSDASVNPEREKKYLKTDPFYVLTPAIFYDKRKFPDGLQITHGKELNQYELCGSFGYNFQPFIDAGVTRKIDTSAHDNLQNLKKLLLGRCEMFLSLQEIILGAEAAGQYKVPQEIGFQTVPNAKEFVFHMWFSRDSRRAPELIEKINAEIVSMRRSGEWEKIFKRYIPTGSGLKPLEP